MTYCTKCGKQNTDTAKFCTGCGATFNVANDKNSGTVKQAEPGKKKTLHYTGLAVFLIAAGIATWILFFKKGKQEDVPATTQSESTMADTATRTTENIRSAANSPEKTRTLELRYKETSIGDLVHQIFTDVSTGQDIELEYDEATKPKWEAADNEIFRLCPDEGNCSLTGQMYKADQAYKLTDEYEWTGETLEKTGKKVMAWVTTSLTKMAKGSSNQGSYNAANGKLIFKSDCYVIITGSFGYEADAINEVKRIRNSGHSNAGYLWIPDYPSLSGKQFYAPYIGPFASYSDCEYNIRSLTKTGRFWYGVKVSYQNDRVEIR